MGLEDGTQSCSFDDFTGQFFPGQDVSIEGIMDRPCYLFLLGPSDLVFLVLWSRSYPV